MFLLIKKEKKKRIKTKKKKTFYTIIFLKKKKKAGKVHFGFIYGVGTIGCLGIYLLLNLMCDQSLSIYQCISVLGYCILPIVLLASVGIIFNLNGIAGYILSGLFIVWSTNSASLIFITALSMSHQRLLVAYPVGLFYISFALMAVF